jgi:hypothetical protein
MSHVCKPATRVEVGQDGCAPLMAAHEVSRARAAAEHARRAVAGPLGELAARELTAYAEFGRRGTGDALVPLLARQILALSRLPDTPP